ncbi:MAG: UDP-N-acetylmuramate--L-alanine ligase [Deltaproteobacteria bacterium]|nr:UDP-N-acetylmuramate--L-alanine ligase [Deltaproteobacteria bacterium]
MKRTVKRIHFVGIGGIGMSGIAEVLMNLDYAISGSDLAASDITERLARLGARIYEGHHSTNLGDADVVVTSTAITQDNPEVMEAKSRGVPIIARAEMLAELLKMKFSIAVSGCHGKTTTTSMVATILANGGLDPTVVIGGRLDSIGSNARLGKGEVIVAEADESDGSFLMLSPTITVVTNIDREHLDYYSGIGEIKDAFIKFVNSVPFYGTAVLCGDCSNVRDILPRVKRRIITYGLTEQCEYSASDISFQGFGSSYTLRNRGEILGPISLQVPGLFNVYNSMAAVAVARELDVDFSVIREGIRSYRGVHRRLEIKGTADSITVIDDYGHHPTEIKATLSALRQAWEGKLIVVFQPHRFTRTKALFEDFLDAFDAADETIVTDIYAASEKPIQGIHSIGLCKAIQDRGYERILYLSGFGEIVDYLNGTVGPGDAVLTLGAGNVWKVGELFLAARRGRS